MYNFSRCLIFSLLVFSFFNQVFGQDGTFTFSTGTTSSGIGYETVDGVKLTITNSSSSVYIMGDIGVGDGYTAFCGSSCTYFLLSFSEAVNISTIGCYDWGNPSTSATWTFTPSAGSAQSYTVAGSGTTVTLNFEGITSINITSTSTVEFTIDDVVMDASLPVELTSFESVLINGEVELNWATATEVNNYGFDVERQSVSGGSWTKVGFVEGKGAENVGHNYTFTDTTALPEVDTVCYRLKQLDMEGAYEYSKTVEVVINSSVTGVDESDLPTEFGLSQNYPNPFNPTTTIEYQVPSSSNVTLKVYDLLGREVATLVNGTKAAGIYSIEFDASKLASGIYIYRMAAGDYISVKKLVLLK